MVINNYIISSLGGQKTLPQRFILPNVLSFVASSSRIGHHQTLSFDNAVHCVGFLTKNRLILLCVIIV